MIIRVAKQGQPSQSYSVEEINQRLAQGELAPTDMAWHEGLPKWIPLSRIRGVVATRAAGTATGSGEWAPAQPAVATESSEWGALREQAAIPNLWNPTAAAGWSVLLGASPLFGAILIAQNWKRLPDSPPANATWFWVSAALVLHLTGLGLFVAGLPRGSILTAALNLGLLIAWYVVSCRRQSAYIRQQLQNQYFRKRWRRPLLIGGLSLALYLGVGWLLAWAQRPPRDSEPALKDAPHAP